MTDQKIIVPNIGDFEEVEVIEVLVKEGQKIKKNESVITLESDKSSVEVPSNFSGTIKKINIKVGDKVSEGTIILLLNSEEDSQEEVQLISKDQNSSSEKKNEIIDFPKKNKKKDIQLSSLPAQGKVKPASPNVRKFIRELGADIYKIPGSERSGRVTRDDVKDYIKDKLTVAPVTSILEKEITKNEYEHSEFGKIEVKDIPRVKRLSGPHLVRSWTEIPHVTQHEEIDITEMEQFRSSLRDLYTGQKISITPLAFIMRAMINALKEYPNFNASIDSENGKVTYKKYFHIGVAVDTPHGLMVPKIRDVDQLDIKEISQKLRTVSKLCRELKIDKKEFFGGSMTISSLGGIGGTFFTPIINPPELSILGVGKAYDKVVKNNGQIITRKILPISLSYDHRFIDGAEGARFCVHLSQSLGKDFAFKLAV
ncbi:2-oxo acid dehydrogenase subunit E2 [Pelagibacteraceae bacterium]|jgi:pyruvate dehydrogenase E2 component (dihydrolipoamide acetyltransferase)|nr:2-oxo acid dehydrogenase subunit E2 [Pelagibacteraceae bacterium]